MQLSDIKADIRLRSPWEAVDLGFSMVQTWAKAIYAPWVLFAVVFAIILWFIVPEDGRWWAVLAFWWCKPIYDRLLLNIVSQELFSLHAGTWQSLKKLPSLMLGNGLFSGLTYRRFSSSRGLNLPIWQLEGLKGKRLRDRQNLLHTNAHSQAVWLTVACLHIEIILNTAFFGLVFLFLPSSMQGDFFTQFFLNQDTGDVTYWVDLVGYVFYVASVIIIEPFYVAGSFSLYLNRRTQLEAWDVELVFRNMADRLNSLKNGRLVQSITSFSSLLLLSAILGASLYTPPVFAEEDLDVVAPSVLPVEKSKQVIEELMQTEALSHEKTVSFWRPKDFDIDDDEPDVGAMGEFIKAAGKLFAVLFESILWIALLVAIVLLIVYRKKWLAFFQGGTKKQTEKVIPEVLFCMDIRPDSLPDDIASAAQSLWQQAKQREALSLLYRGALMKLVTQDDVQLEDSHTEGDIIKLSRKVLQERREHYLEILTKTWQRAAYAHRFPNDDEAQHLFLSWKKDFDIPIATAQTEAKR